MHEARIEPLLRTHDFHHPEARQDFLPENSELHLGQAIAHAAVDAEAEGQVVARIRAIDAERVRILDYLVVAVPRDVPHEHLIPFADRLAAEFHVLGCRATHVR